MTDSILTANPKVLVLGAGSWGTGIAELLAGKGVDTTLWARKTEVAEAINQSHTNAHYLPDITLSPDLRATSDLAAVRDADVVVFVVPSAGTAETAAKVAGLGLKDNAVLVSCAKGIERESGHRMSEVIAAHLPDQPLAALSGPNHAEEVVRKLATCAVIGSADEDLAAGLQELFNAPHFRCYRSTDVAGIELGGAIKNTFAIAAGAAQGLGLGDNAIAALVTRGLAEMMRLGTTLGGQPETFIGLSGVGDLITTCYSNHSRNNRVGLALGRGQTLAEAQDSIGMVAEGVPNTRSIHELADKIGVRAPLIDAVYAVLYEGRGAREALQDLLARDLRAEAE